MSHKKVGPSIIVLGDLLHLILCWFVAEVLARSGKSRVFPSITACSPGGGVCVGVTDGAVRSLRVCDLVSNSGNGEEMKRKQ